MQKFQIWQNAWKPWVTGSTEISFPDEWRITMHHMKADTMPGLTKEQMLDRINKPYGMPTIYELAKQGKEAVIIFDDLSRGTPVQPIAELVVEELLRGGIKKESIRFICAVGSHGSQARNELVQKMGERLIEEYPVFNHNPYENNIKIGLDYSGNDVLINKEFYECDVRIGIGSCSPHPMNGYGGGGKILFPGICSIETTISNHFRNEYISRGDLRSCGLRSEIEHMTKMVGSFFKIDTILNERLEAVELFAGDPLLEYYKAAQCSQKLNAVTSNGLKDIVVINANAKVNEPHDTIEMAEQILKDGGDIILINHSFGGRVIHYIYNYFGRNIMGRGTLPIEKRKTPKWGRLIYFTPYPEYMVKMTFASPERVIFAKTWDEVLKSFTDTGQDITASIIADATISFFDDLIR
jgi:nickel-dependent lactate racemase